MIQRYRASLFIVILAALSCVGGFCKGGDLNWCTYKGQEGCVEVVNLPTPTPSDEGDMADAGAMIEEVDAGDTDAGEDVSHPEGPLDAAEPRASALPDAGGGRGTGGGLGFGGGEP